jgi:hypothetical protein
VGFNTFFEISPAPTANGVGNLANIGLTGLAGGEGAALTGFFSSSGAYLSVLHTI